MMGLRPNTKRCILGIAQMWHRMDKKTRNKNRPWMHEQFAKNNYKFVFDECLNQLSPEEQAKILHRTMNQIPVSEMNTVNLQSLEETYRQGGHNLDVWKAVDLCSKYNLPLPGWVIEYLAGTARKLLAIGEVKKDGPQLVFEAIGVRGKELTHGHNARTERDILQKVEARLKIPLEGKKRSLKRACEDVAKKVKKKPETIQKAYSKIKRHKYSSVVLVPPKE